MTVSVSSSNVNRHTEMTTLPRVKDELGLSDSTDDALLIALIQEASAYIRTHTGRDYAIETVTETLPSRGSNRLMLTRTPIVSVTSVALDGSTIGSTDYTLENAEVGTLFRESGWNVTTLFSQFLVAHPTRFGRYDWSVTYRAGYIMPGEESTEGARTLPFDLERACIDIVKTWYLDRKRNPNDFSKKVGDSSWTRFQGSQSNGISPVVMNTLNRWTRHDISI